VVEAKGLKEDTRHGLLLFGEEDSKASSAGLPPSYEPESHHHETWHNSARIHQVSRYGRKNLRKVLLFNLFLGVPGCMRRARDLRRRRIIPARHIEVNYLETNIIDLMV
jgi:hypothetical protein